MQTKLVRLAVLALSVTLTPAVHAEKFNFAAIGDMPYSIPGDYAKFERLISAINAAKPSFTVHIGDVKSGSSPCTDENINKVADYFKLFENPLIFTPGDNEWTDCHREAAGKFDPLERLAFVRKTFYPTEMSLGKSPMKLEHQSADAKFSKFIENTRWNMAGVQFATLHVIGSNNNLQRDQATVNEYVERNAANLAWLDETFAKATADNAKAVVIGLQADMRFDLDADLDSRTGFNDTMALLKKKTIEFGKPVLLIHGDSHKFMVDKPMLNAGKLVENFTRLEVFGSADVHGVMVSVDTDAPEVFGFRPMIIRENANK
jgi:Calcineurin-like phosphoesterase